MQSLRFHETENVSVDKIPMGPARNKGITFYMRQTHIHKYLDTLFELIQKDKINPSFVITHRLPLKEAPAAYKAFRDKQDECIRGFMKPNR